jgi:hypothetical protein
MVLDNRPLQFPPPSMTFPAPPLEGFIVVLQHRPDVARLLETALAHAGATVFVAAWAGFH